MLGRIGKELERRGGPASKVLKGAIDAYLKNPEIEDIPFPLSQKLDQLRFTASTREYRENPNSPELLNQFMRIFWQNAGERVGKTYSVDRFPLTSKEMKEKSKKREMAIFVPRGVTYQDLGKIFPEMQSWAVSEDSILADRHENSGWLWIERTINSPNRNTNQEDLEEISKKEKKQGQTLKTYIIGSQISKLLTDRYFDQGDTWSRLLGSRGGGYVVSAYFDSDGRLYVDSHLYSEDVRGALGGRFEEVIKA